MTKILLKQIPYDTKEYWHWVRLREIVLRLPLGLRFSMKDLLQDAHELIFCGFNENHMIGGLQYVLDGSKAKMRQVAIIFSGQSKGYGKQIVLLSEQILANQGVNEIYCHARVSAVPFYTSIGYQVTSEAFSEVGIPHVKMSKKLSKNNLETDNQPIC
jgi:hypothetical protein